MFRACKLREIYYLDPFLFIVFPQKLMEPWLVKWNWDEHI
uniref:Uncharacterized protein n=1 Tax=Rhizophora mucronata TaxID=61149 RepID=A0A2P2PZF6_RHIMU